MLDTIASERAHQLRDAVVAMATRYGSSMHRDGLAFINGTHAGKSWKHWNRAGDRQFKALQRLTKALRDVDLPKGA